ncbi:MAG: hypothetical protein VX354_03650 [Pseudomonadota bacterium]
MDKVFILVLIAVVGFWAYLKVYHVDGTGMASGDWVAVVGSEGDEKTIGTFSSYDDCVEAALGSSEKGSVYSCSQ